MDAHPVVQIAVISESQRLQTMLDTFGIPSQTPSEVQPVKVWPSGRLVKVFESLGRCDVKGLSLTGRPSRPFGVLSTCKIYRIFGETVLCYPLTFEVSDFYAAADPAVLIDNIKNDLSFVAHRWKLAGRPTYCLVLREDTVWGGKYHRAHFELMLGLLVQLKNGFVDGVRVRVGRVQVAMGTLQNLIGAGCVEYIDFVRKDARIDLSAVPSFRQLHEEDNERSLSLHHLHSCPVELDTAFTESELDGKDTGAVLYMLQTTGDTSMRKQAMLLARIMHHQHPKFPIADSTVVERMEALYRRAEQRKHWWVVRYCAAKLRKTADSLAPHLTTLVVRGLRVSHGIGGADDMTLSKPVAPSAVLDYMYRTLPYHKHIWGVLMQEVLVACARLVVCRPRLFDGILCLRVGSMVDAMQLVLKHHPNMPQMLYNVSAVGNKEAAKDEFASVHDVFELAPSQVLVFVEKLMAGDFMADLNPLEQRKLAGALNRTPARFHDRMWHLMEGCPQGITVYGTVLAQQPLLSDMTEYELAFVLTFEALLSNIVHAEYRQLMLETLLLVSVILERNKEVQFTKCVDMDKLISRAFEMYAKEHNVEDSKDMTPFYKLAFYGKGHTHTTAVYVTKAIVESLLPGQDLTTSTEDCTIS